MTHNISLIANKMIKLPVSLTTATAQPEEGSERPQLREEANLIAAQMVQVYHMQVLCVISRP